MKKIIVIALGLFLATGIMAQEHAGHNHAAAETKTAKAAHDATMYCCTKCDYCATAEGKCPHHHTALVKADKKETKYCCPNCGIVSPVKGQCHASTKPVVRNGELMCALCYDKDGKCPKCGTAMEKVEVRKKANKKKG